MKYSTSFRNTILRRVLPSENKSVYTVAKESEISAITIHSWIAKVKDAPMKIEQDSDNTSACRSIAPLFHVKSIPATIPHFAPCS